MGERKTSDNFMMWLAAFIVNKRKAFIALFALACIYSAVSIPKVGVVNDLTEYLPESTETRQGLDIMNEEFTTFGTAKILVSNITYEKALKLGEETDPLSLILGTTGGCIGETSTIAILAGAVLLLALGIINIRIPVSCFLAFFGILILGRGSGFDEIHMVRELCSGGLMLAFWFMATDYTTSPLTKWGQIIYGVFIGGLAALFRLYGSASEGVSYAILLANLLTPIIEKITVPRAFGRRH